MSLIYILSVLLLQIAQAADVDIINSVCEKLGKKCDAEVLLQSMAELEKISRNSVTKKIEEKFLAERLNTKNGEKIWERFVDNDRLVHTKMLMQGGADLSEALYLTTFYEDVPHLSVAPHQALQDLLRIFRFQFKTKRNKIECLKIQLREKNNICIATKNCSVSCDVLDQPVFDFSSPVKSNDKPLSGSTTQ